MKKDTITNLIDKKISDHLEKGLDICAIQFELSEKVQKFILVITKNTDIPLNILAYIDMEDNTLPIPIKIKWATCYVLTASKRIQDLGWIKKIKPKFKNKTDLQLFNLLLFKEKISIDNAIQEAFYS